MVACGPTVLTSPASAQPLPPAQPQPLPPEGNHAPRRGNRGASFRTVILISALVLIGAILGATLLATTGVLQRNARDRLTEDLQRSRQVFEELQGYRASLFKSQVAVIADEPRLKATVATPGVDAQTIREVAVDHQRTVRADLFLVVDSAAKVLVDVADPAATGTSMAQAEIVAKTLEKRDASGIWVRADKVHQVQARRLEFGSDVVGAIVVGYVIDDRVADTIYNQTASSVVVGLDEVIVARSPLEQGDEIDAKALGAMIARLPVNQGDPVEVKVGKQTYLGLAAAFPGYKGDRDLRYVVLRSLDRALAPARRLTEILYGISAASFGMALVLTLLLASRLSRPIENLINYTRNVAAGNLSLRAKLDGPIEIRALGAAMNRMVGELESSRAVMAQNLRLEQEFEIANQIQTSILPRTFEVPGLEIGAVMLPATEVGGDYYDVRQVAGGSWIGIGDVSGHGLTAGLSMLMIQSLVAALTQAAPEASPSAIVITLNQLLFDNIKHRMQLHQHATLTLLRHHSNGRIVFAGAHEELLLCPAGTGRCEPLETPGTWLAALPDVSDVTVDSEITLAAGDLLVLYTDGVTEATSPGGEMLGVERVCQEIERVRQQPTTGVRDALVGLVRSWTNGAPLEDDVTLVVIRYTGKPASA